ncbi:formate dehydrogenase subunit gamma [Herbaspirillum sp. RTI4]|uniref:formate dehydrogenase subunit gamma n=1 Tax=Herbaspirillum sp. RTI4 TaxID=3048640 RepID=UPI002AB4BDD2|nr:formate dehydrogenase subunit gamma [Herbaspirillum sp. RTI4]MDY7579847.1 formate dehydrogenase subunit gamma [Herbaspirillum sp. RTI4]MEA9981934.1 formate dehydrogenase subunit gamma [Herbaspirillum sp. RTI4]
MNRQYPFDIDAAKAAITAHSQERGSLLPVLHAVQEAIGFIPADVVPLIADELNLSRAEIHGVISFYHFFRQHPAGKNVVQICRAEACQARGGEALAQHAETLLDCKFHATSSDGQFTLESVYCLGQCACGPNIMINDELHARVGADKLDRLIGAKRGTP